MVTYFSKVLAAVSRWDALASSCCIASHTESLDQMNSTRMPDGVQGLDMTVPWNEVPFIKRCGERQKGVVKVRELCCHTNH